MDVRMQGLEGRGVADVNDMELGCDRMNLKRIRDARSSPQGSRYTLGSSSAESGFRFIKANDDVRGP